uniref:Uncharacterized protein n=1 Tax=Glossina pallidipes TaxID=7398 RepID=A0A1B0A7N6_GLOPL
MSAQIRLKILLNSQILMTIVLILLQIASIQNLILMTPLTTEIFIHKRRWPVPAPKAEPEPESAYHNCHKRYQPRDKFKDIVYQEAAGNHDQDASDGRSNIFTIKPVPLHPTSHSTNTPHGCAQRSVGNEIAKS